MANTPGEAHNLTSGYYTRYTYRLNTTADAIKRYVVLTNGSLQSQGVYEADQLTVYRTLNAQDGNSSQQQENLEYTDALGRTIASEVRVSDQDRRITYYVYDDLNRLRYILPPMADTYDCSTPKTAQQLGDYCYYSEYDERGNIIKSQNPGAEYSLAIYDRRGRLAMSQSGKQRINNEWSFTKYDVFDRPVLSGIITGGTYESHKAALDAATVFYEERGTTVHGYTNQSYPSVPNANSYLTVTYYDDYDWLAANDPHAFSTADALGQTHTTDVVGLTTGVKNKVLGISTDQWLTTVTYYDHKYQTIQAISDLYPSGTEITSNTHDFLGNVTQTKVKQSVGGSTYEYNKWFNYDNFGRLLSIQQQITGDATNGKVTLVSYTYDNLGNVASKSIHNGAETETYTYDLNGRVIASTSPSFSYTLDYEQSDLPGATPRLDGQITALRWGAGQTPNRAYAYTYDPVGQLSAAAYKTATNGTWSASNAYAEKNLTYDRHGNIKTLQRTDANGSVLHELSDMTYTGNKLQSLKLNGGNPVNYAYDQNGNITSDGRRGVTINYNILNFPEQIIAGNQQVSYIYSAAGEKLATNANGSLTYYRSVMVYGNDNKLLYILTTEGTVTRTEGSAGTSYTYNYFKKDQIGSTRAVLSAVGNTLQNVQSTDYYPFGLAYSTNNLNKNKYLFSGKELQDASIGGTILGLYDFGARQYDPVIGRWMVQDRFASKYAQISPYTYCANNPILFTDPTGDTLKVHIDGQTYYFESNGWGFGFFSTFGGPEATNLSRTAVSVLWDLRLLSSPATPTGSMLIDYIRGSDYTVTIVTGDFKRNTYHPTSYLNASANSGELIAGLAMVNNLNILDEEQIGCGGIIYYNPYRNTGGYNQNGNFDAPAYIGLAHELAHAYDGLSGNLYYYADMGGYTNHYMGLEKAEWQAIYIENQIRGELNQPLRTHYAITKEDRTPVPPYLLDKNDQPMYYKEDPLRRLRPPYVLP